MNKPVLVVMAAGMGSRYGGKKQIDPIDSSGHLIIDYSIFDAKRAGFETVVFVIKHEMEEEFRAAIGDRIAPYMDVRYAFQDIADLPEGYCVPEGRVKPWGTAHAAAAVREIVDGPFAIINADDYYGPKAFSEIYQYLLNHPDDPACYEYAMVGYLLNNTVTENGSVARGVCSVDENGYLADITERTQIVKGEKCPRYTEDDGKTWTDLPGDTVVSMNLWGFHKSYLTEVWSRFPAFLDKTLKQNPLKGEYYLPGVVNELLEENHARVKLLVSEDKWYGVTYKDDKPTVMAAIQRMRDEKLYPEKLWN